MSILGGSPELTWMWLLYIVLGVVPFIYTTYTKRKNS